MPPSPQQPRFSYKAEKAKADTIRAFKDTITQKVAENWGVLHPDGKPPRTAENIQAEVDSLIRPPAAPDGTKPKYTTKFGMNIPSEETMEEFGNASARAVDKGTQTFGMSWLNTIVVAIQALFDWISGGSKSFTESFAKITSRDITKEFEGEMAVLAQDPAHKKFMDEQSVLEKGREKINSGVQREAGLDKSPAQPAFNLDEFLKTNPLPVAAPPPAVAADKPDAAIESSVKWGIDQTLAQFDAQIKGLQGDQLSAFNDLKEKLGNNAKAIATDVKDKKPDAPKNAEEFADRAIKKTIEEMDPKLRASLGLNGNLSRAPMKDLIQQLGTSSDANQQGASLLLTSLRTNMMQSYSNMSPALGVTVTDDDKRRQAAEIREEKKSGAEATIKRVDKTVADTIASNVDNGMREFVAVKIAEKKHPFNLPWTPDYIKIVKAYSAENYNKDEKSGEYSERKMAGLPLTDTVARDKAYDEAVARGSALNGPQLALVAKITGEVTRDYMKELDPKAMPSKEQAAEELAKRVNNALKARERDIGNLGMPGVTVAKINEKLGKDKDGKPSDILAMIATSVGDSVRNNQKSKIAEEQWMDGAYDQLKAAVELRGGASTTLANLKAADASYAPPEPAGRDKGPKAPPPPVIAPPKPPEGARAPGG